VEWWYPSLVVLTL